MPKFDIIEVKTVDHAAYGYLWRVVKESFSSEKLRFKPDEIPHPDSVSEDGFIIEFGVQSLNRRIWFRLMQNGWKHNILYRNLDEIEWTRFPRPRVVTEVIRQFVTPDTSGFDETHYTEENGWDPSFSHNIHVPTAEFKYPRGKFFLSIGNDFQTLVNTNGVKGDPVYHYEVKTALKKQIADKEVLHV